MHRIKNFSAYLFLPVLLFIAITLTSCSQEPPQQSMTIFSTDLTQTSAQYLTQAQQTSGATQIDWLLLAANASIKEKNSTQANSILQHLINQPLSKGQQQELYLTQGMLAYFEQDATLAQQSVAKLNPQNLAGEQLYHYYLIQVYLNQADPLQQLTAYIELEKVAENVTEQHQIINETWQMLSKVTSEQMNKFVINANNVTLQGWLDLWQVKQKNQSNFNSLQTAVAAWQARYPYNPAATYLPRAIFAPYYTLPTDNSTLKVALLLPLSGDHQSVGKAMLLGFEQAMSSSNLLNQNILSKGDQSTDNNKVQGNNSEADSNTATEDSTHQLESSGTLDSLWLQQEIAQHLKIYDTNSTKNINSLIEQAQQAGVQLIVGPWLSENVTAIESLPTNLPILALNTPDTAIPSSGNNICYFSTSPTEEAREAAEYIYHQGKKAPLVLAPNNALGHAIANAFAKAWQDAGGNNALGQFFPNKATLTHLMNKGIGISIEGQPLLPSVVSNTVSSGADVTQEPTDTVASQPKLSDSVDAIYIVASKDQLLLLKPMLEMLSPQQKTQPEIALKQLPQIYMSSFARQQDEGTDFNLEMNNIIFSDMPILDNKQQAQLKLLPSYISDNYVLARAYAVGEDAWGLAQNYTQLRSDPSYRLQGETGLLSVGKNCVIQRKPVWQKYSNGDIVTLP